MDTKARSENSVQFSLGELMKLEDERVAEQVREREANERAAVEAKIEAERQAEAAVHAKLRADEAAEAQRRRHELDEIARREALQKATVEQARLEVESRTRADERERERQHELALQSARATTPKPTSLGSLLAATGLGGGLMLVVTCILHFAVMQPVADRRMAELDLRATTAEQKVTEAATNAERTKKTIAQLEQHAAALEAENKELRSSANSPVKPATPSKPGVHSTTAPAKPRTTEQACDDKDPMCFTIKPKN